MKKTDCGIKGRAMCCGYDTGEIYVSKPDESDALKTPTTPEPANPSKAREKTIHEVIQWCTTMTSFYRTVSNFSIALIAERADRDRWKERAEKAEEKSAELLEELRITREQRDAAAKKQASTAAAYKLGKEMSASVWKTHEAQFSELEAERDRLKAALAGLVNEIDGDQHFYSRVDRDSNVLAAARAALKGPNQ